MDEVIFEEFKGTGNSEINLDRKLSQKRTYPAIDIGKSGTRKEELLVRQRRLNKNLYFKKNSSDQWEQQNLWNFYLKKWKQQKHNADFFQSMGKK